MSGGWEPDTAYGFLFEDIVEKIVEKCHYRKGKNSYFVWFDCEHRDSRGPCKVDICPRLKITIKFLKE